MISVLPDSLSLVKNKLQDCNLWEWVVVVMGGEGGCWICEGYLGVYMSIYMRVWMGFND